MTYRRLFAVLLTGLLIAPATVLAAECEVPAYWIGAAKAGLEIREAPDDGAGAAGTIPFLGDLPPADLTIIGAKDGWLQVGKVSTPDSQIYSGTGWIKQDDVRTNIANSVAPEMRPPSNLAPVFAKPDKTSLLISELAPASEIEVLGCTGKWLKTRIDGFEGWVRPVDVCGDPVGFCQQIPLGGEEEG